MPKILGTKRHSAQPIRQRGFALPMMAWGALAAGAVILALGVAVKVQSARLHTAQAEREAVRAEFSGFKSETKRLGDAANKAARDQEAKDKKAKEKADADNLALQRDLDTARKRLRDARRTSGSLVPAAPAGSASPDRAAFDRAQLERALSEFVDEVEGLVGEGDHAVIKLDSAKRWAQERK